MKPFIFILILFGLASCQITAPTFKNLGQWRVANINGSQVTVSNVAYFYNPNKIDGLKLNAINLAVQTEGKNLGKVEISEPGMSIPKLSDFQVPISFVVSMSDLIGNLASIINIVSGKTVDLRCVGEVKVGYAVINKSIRIDQTLPINIKDIK
ncbi:MAG: LEA type 2 family protein [Chitinophagales bacterium]|nr:LEA type 2 family protein [Chitinophagales bacterium]